MWQSMGPQRVGHACVTEQEQVLERGAKAEDMGEGLFGPHGVLLGYTQQCSLSNIIGNIKLHLSL